MLFNAFFFFKSAFNAKFNAGIMCDTLVTDACNSGASIDVR